MLTFCVLVGAATIADYRSKRIPNVLIALLLLWGVLYDWIWLSPAEAFIYMGKAAVFTCMAFPFYRIGSIGAGDIKLLAVCCGFLESDSILSFLFFTLLFAAIISIYRLMKYKMTKQRLAYFLSYISEVRSCGRWLRYIDNQRELGRVGICMSGPVFASLLIHMGGVY